MERVPLIVLLGPTAVGKTEISIKLAKEINAEIISADSMQIYCYMDIGTAKVNPKQRKIVKHYMIDIIEPDENFSVASYQDMVDDIIPAIISKEKTPLLVGGTGLYIKAVVEGFLFPKMNKDRKLRERLKKIVEEKGNEYLHKKLCRIDPELGKKLHPNDIRRIIRGIEVYKITGKPLTYFKRKQKEQPDRYRALKIGLNRKRNELYSRINQRVDQMIEHGLIEEVKGLLKKGYQTDKTAFQGLGYKEVIAYLEGDYSLDEAISLIKKRTRNYAKRQLTWFSKDKNIKWVNLSEVKKEVLIKTAKEKINIWKKNNRL